MKYFFIILLFVVGCVDSSNQPIENEERVWTGFTYDSSIVIDSWTALDNRRKIYARGYIINRSSYDIIMTPKLHAYVLDNDTSGIVVVGNPTYFKIGDTVTIHVETELFIPPWYYKPRGEFEFIDKRWIVQY